MNPSNRRILLTAAAGIGLSVSLGGCVTDSGATASSDAPRPSTPASTQFRDGVYSADGVYGSGPSSIGVELRLEDGRIAEVDVTPHATNETSLGYQNDFAGGVSAVVVGRPIADLEVGRVAGSSSTPDGFNDALDKIRSDAAA